MRIVVDPKKLNAIMLEKGLSQSELARRTGIARPHISAMCRGGWGKNLDTIARVIGALGLSSLEPILQYLPDEHPPKYKWKGRRQPARKPKKNEPSEKDKMRFASTG